MGQTWRIVRLGTSGAFNHKSIIAVPKAHIADSVVLYLLIRKIEKVLKLYGTSELVVKKLAHGRYVKDWPPLI